MHRMCAVPTTEGSSACGGWRLWRVAAVAGGGCGGWRLWWVAAVAGGGCGGWRLWLGGGCGWVAAVAGGGWVGVGCGGGGLRAWDGPGRANRTGSYAEGGDRVSALADSGMPTYLGMPPFPVAAAAALGDSQLRSNLGRATGVIRAKRAAAIGRAGRLARTPRGRQGDQGSHPGLPGRLPDPAGGTGDQRGRPGALGRERGGSEPDRRFPGPGRGRGPGGQGEVDHHPGDRAERGPGRGTHQRARDRPGRAHRAAGSRPAEPLPGPGHPPQPGGDQGHLPARDGRRPAGPDRRAGRPGRRRPGAPAAPVPPGHRGHLRRQLRHRGHRHPGGGRIRGQRANVPDPAGNAHLRGRHREDPAVLARPGGLPARCCPGRPRQSG